MDVKFFHGKTALQKIKSLKITENLIEQWFHDKNVSCYILYEEDTPKSFALMSKMDFDPLKTHSPPKTLNFIFTLEEHRRKGYARQLVLHIKKSNQFTAFCSNDDSVKLFTICDCVNHGEFNHNIMFRYP